MGSVRGNETILSLKQKERCGRDLSTRHRMKKVYISLFLLIALFAFIFFVIDINLSGNINTNTNINTETKKEEVNYIDNNYLINLNDVPLKYEVNLENECFDVFGSSFYTDELKWGSYQTIVKDNNNKINYVVELENKRANIYFNDKLIYSGESGKYGMEKLCKYNNYYVTSEMVEFYSMISIIKDGKLLLRYHGSYEVNDGVFTVYEIDYDNGMLKVYDINLDNFEFSSVTIEKDYCSDEVAKKYNRKFCFE